MPRRRASANHIKRGITRMPECLRSIENSRGFTPSLDGGTWGDTTSNHATLSEHMRESYRISRTDCPVNTRPAKKSRQPRKGVFQQNRVTCGHSRTHSGCRSLNGSELERTAANWRGSFRFITRYAVGQKSVLSRHPVVGNLGGNFRKRIHKGMNLLKLPLEFDSSPGHSNQILT